MHYTFPGTHFFLIIIVFFNKQLLNLLKFASSFATCWIIDQCHLVQYAVQVNMPILLFSYFCVSLMDLFRFYVDLISLKSSLLIHLVWYLYLGISHCCCQSGAHYHKSLSRRAFIILSQSLAPLITQYTSNIYFRVKTEDDDNDDTYIMMKCMFVC